MEQSLPSFTIANVNSARRVAVVITAAFAVFALIWMLISDLAVYWATGNSALAARIDMSADWLFIVIAGVMLYLIVYRAASRLIRTRSVLTAIVESMGDGVLLLGPDRRVIHANPAALRLLECDESELIGMTGQQFARRFRMTKPNGALVHPDALASQRVFEQAGPVRLKSVLHPSPEGAIFIDTTASAVRPGLNEPPALVVSVFHDITAAEHLEALRDNFFAAAAHALKTPAAIIKANIEYSARKMPESALASYYAIERQCERIDRLVQNLQVVSRARSRSLELHLRHMDLAPLVLKLMRDLPELKPGLEIRSDLIEPVPIYGDRERLSTAVRNLAYEALQEAKSGTALAIQLEVRDSHAELRMRYEPLPVAQRQFATLEEYDDTALSRCATETIIRAHGGEVGDKELEEDSAVRWLRVPITEEAE